MFSRLFSTFSLIYSSSRIAAALGPQHDAFVLPKQAMCVRDNSNTHGWRLKFTRSIDTCLGRLEAETVLAVAKCDKVTVR